MSNTAELLQTLFEADTEAPDYFDTAPDYDLNQALGWPPWFPLASECWASPEPTSTWPGDRSVWLEARARLEALHAEYRQARGD